MTVTIRPSKVEDAYVLGNNLRESDQKEIKAGSGRGPLEALVNAFKLSDPDLRWTAFYNDEPIVMWGAARRNLTTGSIWLLASDDVYRIRKIFLKNCPIYLKTMHERYQYLFNWVDIKHESSLNWLHGLGFSVTGFDPRYGHGKAPFLMFTSYRDRNNV